MTNEEARWILKFHRPDRPRSTEMKQLQKAIDVILDEGEWLDSNEDWFDHICSSCGLKTRFVWNYCPECGKKMKYLS